MKVLIICHKNPFPPNDGGSMGIYTMIHGLLFNQIQTDVLIMNPIKLFKPLDSKYIPASIQNIKSIKINTNINVFKALKNLLFEKQSYFISRFYDQNFETILIDFLKNNTYNIIQLESIFSAIYINVIKKYSSAKIVLSAHNIEHQIWQRVNLHQKNIIKKQYLDVQIKRLKTFEDTIFKSVDGITSVTEIDKQYIQSIAPEKPVVVTPNGMEVKNIQPVLFEQQDIHTIFFLGSLDWIPNQQGILWFMNHVWPIILKQKPNTKIIIAGKNIPEFILKRKDKNTTYISNIPDVKLLYNHYAITIVPLLAGSGIRVKIIESMVYSKCIVSTTIGAEGVPYTHDKNIIIADTVNDFAEAIIQLMNNPDKIKQIQKEARWLAEQNYDKEKVYLPLINMYQELINHKK